MDHKQCVFIDVYSEDWSWSSQLNISGSLTSQYNKITFTTPSGKQLHPYTSVYLSHPDGGTNDHNNDSISGMGYISKLKLEEGSAATPWSPAPSESHPTYMGTYTDFTQSASSDPTKYQWSLIKGADGKDGAPGIPGAPGKDGKTYYLHVAYAQNPKATDGNTGFTTSPDTSVSYNYIGTYTDANQNGSTDATRYTWVAMFDSTKKRNFTTQPTTPYAVGDTWTDRGATYFCTNARDNGAYDASDWTMQQLTIHSLAPSVTNSLYNDNLLTGTSEDEKSGKSYSFADYQISGGLQPGTTYTLSGWARVDQTAMDNQQHVFVCAYTRLNTPKDR